MSRLSILAPVVRGRKGEYRKLFEKYLQEGFMRARVDGEIHLLEDPPSLERHSNHNIEIIIDRLSVSGKHRNRIEMSVKHALEIGGGLVIVSRDGEGDLLYSEILACPDCDIDIPTLEPRSFSFNSRYGACPKCNGIGHSLQVNLARLISDTTVPCSALEISLSDRNLTSLFKTALSALLDHFEIPAGTRFDQVPMDLTPGPGGWIGRKNPV